MFKKLGQFVSRFWLLILCGWGLLLTTLYFVTPSFESQLVEGEFAFLPPGSPSLQAEELFANAFPDDLLKSTIVIVARRPSRRPEGLLESDRTYIHETLVPILQSIGVRSNEEERESDDDASWKQYEGRFQQFQLTPEESQLVYRIRDWTSPSIGHLLDSEDRQATLVIISLTSEFVEDANIPIIEEITKLRKYLKVHPDDSIRIPDGMELALSGTATVGRDMRVAGAESAKRTESATIILVLFLLILIYRAPLLAIIPLLTVIVAVKTSMFVLPGLSELGFVNLFRDIEIYITVLVYGAGVDYCLFLIARYKEELDAGATYDEASARSIEKVGAALAASAGTSGIGIGMMAFAEFGKFQEAGVAIFFSLMICLLTALTFAPAFIRLCGKWAFWPYIPHESVARLSWISPTTLIGRIMQSGVIDRVWDHICVRIRKHPGRIWIATVLLMVPFAAVGYSRIDDLSYGLLTELPDDYLSVQGARAAQEHFSPGETGAATILLQNPSMDFTEEEIIARLADLAQTIKQNEDALNVDDVRSVASPTGVTPRAEKYWEDVTQKLSLLEIRIRNKWTHDYYVTQVEELNHGVTRIDVVFKQDPFSRNMLSEFIEFQEQIRALVRTFDENVKADISAAREALLKDEEVDPEELDPLVDIVPTKVSFLGPTASMADLKQVTDRDQFRIEWLVLLVVYIILVILLRRVAISFYLLMTVFFTFFVSLGVAYSLFYALDPAGFAGLDWKVPIFLFTILIAVGEDYNILLITRIEEEQKEHGHVEGTLAALGKTGSIISSCGIIMAGTFSSLLFGTLLGLQQLGFALAFGVILDTFIVRPLLVPAWLVMLYRGYFGPLSRFLGAPAVIVEQPPSDDSETPAGTSESTAESPSVSP